MRILTGKHIQEADRLTAERRHITGLELMEEASLALAGAVSRIVSPEQTEAMPLLFLTGKGNNGGDALAVARILHQTGYRCEVLLTAASEDMSPDAAANLRRLPAGIPRRSIGPASELEACLHKGQWVVDALLGSGVRGAVKEPVAALIRCLNASGARVIAIDMPSGLPTEPPQDGSEISRTDIVEAEATLTVGFPKLSLLLPETGGSAGKVIVTALGLDQDYIESTGTPLYYTQQEDVRRILRPRPQYAHKGDYGHALLVCGSVGMVGAALLSAQGALRSGCGLVTVHLPEKESTALYCTSPSAMIDPDPEPYFSVLPKDMGRYTAVGCGCGLGRNERTATALEALMRSGLPMVLDADALNIVAGHPELRGVIPAGSVLTPHLGELRRLTGQWSGPYDRLERALLLARETGSCVVVKGAHTAVISPDGDMAFNSTGNPGMAKGGSGDVLTGLLAGLLASGYNAYDAARLGVWLHGKAGDIAASMHGLNGMNSQDIALALGKAFLSLEG